jgi:cytochrome c peroxidase
LCAATGCHAKKHDALGEREVEIHFDARVGEQRVTCDRQLEQLGANGRTAQIEDLRFFVHDVQLIDDAGKKVAVELADDDAWQYRNVGLIDLEDASGSCGNGSPEINPLLRGKVPEGRYTGLFFRVGVPAELNHVNPALYPAPLSNTALHWVWLLGYKFFRLDLNLTEDEERTASGFEVHLGSDQCSRKGSDISCKRENVAEVELSSFDTENDKVVLDLGALLSGVSLERKDGEESVPGCTSKLADRDCDPVFTAFGLDLKSGTPRASQRVFRAEAREEEDPTRAELDASDLISEETDAGSERGDASYELERPPHFPRPNIPELNPLSAEKVELGRHLFYDKRLSLNETQACASCHKQELAFTDGLAVGVGSTGQKHSRGAMSLANLVYSTTFTWVNPLVSDLEIQSTIPLFGDTPVELGFKGRENELNERLRNDATYQRLFRAAYPEEKDPFTVLFIARAIASFERTLISGNSAYDRYKLGDDDAISESAKHGEALFFDTTNSLRTFECFHCHGGPTFSDQLTHDNSRSGDAPFHNTGLYNIGPYGSYPEDNPGLFEFTGREPDRGRFKAPTLRNIAKTAPYMHDGSIATLEDVVAHYAAGGRNIESGPHMGDGRLSKNKNILIHGFSGASQEDRQDLVAFLKSLTDEDFLTNPKFANPWP